MRARLALLAVALLVGCGGGGGAPPPTNGAVQGSVQSGVMAVPVSVEGVAAMAFVVDSGSPITLLDPTHFPTLSLSTGFSTVATLDVGNVHLSNVPVFGASPCGMMMCTGSQPSGLLGGDVLSQFALTIDYRNQTVTFGATGSRPAGTTGAVTAPFALEGGGQGTIAEMGDVVSVPATRIALDVSIEGTLYPFVLDTGSSAVVLDNDLYDMIVSDGRQQGSIEVSTVNGTAQQPITFLHEVAVDGASQSNVQAIRTPRDLGGIAREVGHEVRGLLGGSYLSRYTVTIDYPARELSLLPN